MENVRSLETLSQFEFSRQESFGALFWGLFGVFFGPLLGILGAFSNISHLLCAENMAHGVGRFGSFVGFLGPF